MAEQVLYYCPTAREIEQQPGGGFATCCNAPELHEPVLAIVYAAIQEQIAELIAAKGDEIAEEYQQKANVHRDLSDRTTLHGQRHWRSALAFKDKADGAWAVAHAAREIGGVA